MYRFKTAVFGTGFVGRVHLDVLRRLGYVEIAANAESETGKARRLAAKFDVPRAEQDYRSILEDPTIGVVHVCTPNYLYFPMARDALLAGEHVLCEKPLALSVAEAGTGRPKGPPQLHIPQLALLPHGSEHAAHARKPGSG
jgi:predicted dehydrogenase